MSTPRPKESASDSLATGPSGAPNQAVLSQW